MNAAFVGGNVEQWARFRAIFPVYLKRKSLVNVFSVKGCHIRRCYGSGVTNGSGVYDIVVAGGGIVGIATARELLMRQPHLKIVVLEKERKLAYHQTGHNSGVIHAGIYYKPGSLKAKLCVKGLHKSYEFCDQNKIPYKKVGKLIVATNDLESERLEDLIDRGKRNNVPDMKVVDKKGIKEIEPICEGVRAISSPHTGIVDWGEVAEKMGEDFVGRGGHIKLNFKVSSFGENKKGSESENKKYPLLISSKEDSVKSSFAVVCCGLHSDKLAVLSGCPKDPKIIPVRGEYLFLSPEKAKLIKGNIYPVPDPRFPFLGVHFTPRMDGSIWLGPNAVLAFKREGYRWRDVNIFELIETLTYPGFVKLAVRNTRFGFNEMLKSWSLKKQVKELQKYVPSIEVSDVKRGHAGVRAQALNRDGTMVDDFVFDVNKNTVIGRRILHCRNAPSPGATSSLAIAELIADRVQTEFHLEN